MKTDTVSDLNMFYGKMSDFVSFSLPVFTLVINWEILILKVMKILKYFLKKKNDVRFDCVPSSSVFWV